MNEHVSVLPWWTGRSCSKLLECYWRQHSNLRRYPAEVWWIVKAVRAKLEDGRIEALLIEVKLDKRQLLVYNFYRLPDAKAELTDEIAVMIDHAVQVGSQQLWWEDLNWDLLPPNSVADVTQSSWHNTTHVGYIMELVESNRVCACSCILGIYTYPHGRATLWYVGGYGTNPAPGWASVAQLPDAAREDRDMIAVEGGWLQNGNLSPLHVLNYMLVDRA